MKQNEIKTNATTELSTDFTAKERQRYESLTKVIVANNRKMGSAALAIAGALLEIKDKKLYLIDHKSFAEYCIVEHGMSAGNSSDAVNTFARFKKPDKYELLDEYKDVDYTKLKAAKDLSDYEIENLKIFTAPTVGSMKNTIRAYRAIKDQLPPSWTFEDAESAVKSWRQQQDAKAIADKAADIDHSIIENQPETSANPDDTPFPVATEIAEEARVEESVFYVGGYDTAEELEKDVVASLRKNWKKLKDGVLAISIQM